MFVSALVSVAEHGDGETPPKSGGSAAYEPGVERLAAAVAAAVEGEDEWDARVAAGLRAGLEFLAADSALARLLLVEALAAGGDARLERERSVARLAEALRPPVELTGGKPVSDEILLLQAHGLVSYLSGRVLAGEAGSLPETHDALLEYLLAGVRNR
jgi:hypothetical protein